MFERVGNRCQTGRTHALPTRVQGRHCARRNAHSCLERYTKAIATGNGPASHLDHLIYVNLADASACSNARDVLLPGPVVSFQYSVVCVEGSIMARNRSLSWIAWIGVLLLAGYAFAYAQ